MLEPQSKTLLLVEDEALIAMAERVTLERFGYAVVVANSGERAIEIVHSNAPIDLILMDIDLGSGIDGTRAAQIILGERDVPLVFLSSHTERETVEKTEGITSYGYIVKNSGETVLLTSIRMAFRLFESRSLAADTFKHSMNGLCVHRMLYDESGAPFDCEYLTVNAAFEEHTGLPAARVVGRTIRDIYPNHEADEAIDLYARVLESRESTRRELFFAATNSWFELSVFPTRDAGFTVVLQNITDRKEAEHALAAEREWLNVTLRSVGDAVIATDVDGAVVLMNPVAERLTGWSQEAARGRPVADVFEIVNAMTRIGVEIPVDRALREGKVVGLANHTVLISREGVEYQIADSAAPIRGSNGTIVGVVLVFRDVTEEYAREQALRDSERDMERAQALTEVGSWRFEIGSGTVVASVQARRIYGIGDATMTVKEVQTIPLPEYRERLDAALRNLVANGVPYDVEFQIRRRSDNAVRWIHSIAEFDAEHNRVVGTIQDVTDRVVDQERLKSIEWMLGSDSVPQHDRSLEYGDLHLQNRDGLILKWAGSDRLREVVADYLDLLDTSATIHEQNGDYALGVDSSGWCRLLDEASRKMCATDDNREAIGSGRWLCRDSCWKHAALPTIRSGHPTETPCAGGIALYSVPIRVHGEVVGAMSVGFGSPPTDDARLAELSREYSVPIPALRAHAEAYQARPAFIIEYAKKRLARAAVYLGSLIERNMAEAEVRELLDERSALLREVQHRARNTLRTMGSLLSLEADRVTEPAAREALDAMRRRFRSMELLFEQLSCTDAAGSVAIDAYVTRLVQELVQLFPGGERVQVSIVADSHELDAKRVGTLGMIVTELVTNAMKHAFRDDSESRLSVSATRRDGRVVVVVADNGPGLATSADRDRESGLGMSIVHALAEQLRGTISFESDGGTRAILDFAG
ncbi:MAG: PAS domain S-box protein [Spirochaetaceae bacterium]|nr:MAG: PAS domain S-box protein [Spirochaetaceae bacterium]